MLDPESSGALGLSEVELSETHWGILSKGQRSPTHLHTGPAWVQDVTAYVDVCPTLPPTALTTREMTQAPCL